MGGGKNDEVRRSAWSFTPEEGKISEVLSRAWRWMRGVRKVEEWKREFKKSLSIKGEG